MLTAVHIKYINVGSYLIMGTSPHSRRSFLRTFGLRNTHYVLYASLVEDVGCVLNIASFQRRQTLIQQRLFLGQYKRGYHL